MPDLVALVNIKAYILSVLKLYCNQHLIVFCRRLLSEAVKYKICTFPVSFRVHQQRQTAFPHHPRYENNIRVGQQTRNPGD